MTTDQITEGIKCLEAQVIYVQDNEFGTTFGSEKINALNAAIGRYEKELKAIQNEGLYFEFCSDIENDFMRSSWDCQKCEKSTDIKYWIHAHKFTKCKKVDAKFLLVVGEKDAHGCWIVGSHKNYWLK